MLKYIRPGEQFLQLAPFWLDARQVPSGTNRTLTLAPGETKADVDFREPKADVNFPIFGHGGEK